MSVVTIQIGQCGNQIGERLFETLISDCYDISASTAKTNKRLPLLNGAYLDESIPRFFSENETTNTRWSSSNDSLPPIYARSVLIDMESKVVNRLIYNNASRDNATSKRKWCFRDSNSYTQKRGSGNNWSYGYCVNGPKSADKIEDIIRKEVERCDRLASFLVCMSLAGGTGSGVGSYYTELLKTFYPRTAMVNNCVWPFSTGEVTLQNYNSLLTLNKLYEHSDGIILLENDLLHQICKRLNISQGNKSTIESRKEITFNDLNSVIAHKLASVLQPAVDSSRRSNYLNELLVDLCCDVDYKLLSLNNLPQMSKQSIEYSSFKWNGLYRSAKQILYTGGFMEEGLNWNETNHASNRTLAMSLFARGAGDDEHTDSFVEQNEYRKAFFDDSHHRQTCCFSTNLFGSVLSTPVRLWYNPRPFMNYEKSLTLLSNSQSPVFKIERLLEKAWKMFASRAYVHQYVKYENFEEEQLLNSLLFAEQIIKNYKKF